MPQETASEFNVLNRVFEVRLQQADMERILDHLDSLNRRELVTKISQIVQRMTALLEVTNRTSSSLSLDRVLPQAMEIITESLHVERSSLFLYDVESDELFSRVAQGDGVGEIRIPATAGIAGAVFKSGSAVTIPDAYADSRFNQETDRRSGFHTRNILCAPLRTRQGQIIGVAQALNKHEGDFTDDDLELLQAVTTQAANALEHAKLFESFERARHEESRLLEITNAISRELQLDTLLEKIIDAATDMLDADRATLFIYDAKSQELWSRVARGLETREIRFPADRGIAGASFSNRAVINIPDAYADPRFNQDVDKQTGYHTRNILTMPIMTKDLKGVGVIQVLNKSSGAFGHRDERRLTAFAAQAAIALENAKLFDDVLNVKNYNESILKSLSNGVITLDTERRIIKVNDAAQAIMAVDAASVENQALSEVFLADPWISQGVDKVAATGTTDMALDVDLHVGAQIKSINLNTVQLIDIKEEPIGYMLVLEDISREKRVKSTMARYMTKEVMDQLLQGGAEVLGGALQEVTILFSDIRQFTTIAEHIGARETVRMLNEYFTEMVEIIFAHKGMLDKYIGDAIMALFGAPLGSPKDADNGMAVAIAMIRALRRINSTRLGRGQVQIEIGVGLSTGEVVAGNIGSPKRMDYTVIGDPVNLSSRLESATKYYGTQILLSEFTLGKLTTPGRYREIDLMRVKGKQRPVAIFDTLDHLEGEQCGQIDQVLSLFADGLKAYRAQQWGQALEAFAHAQAVAPWDLPSKLYMDRCIYYRDKPPEGDWDGVWVMSSK